MVPFEGWQMAVQYKGLVRRIIRAVASAAASSTSRHKGVLTLPSDGVKERPATARTHGTLDSASAPGEALYHRACSRGGAASAMT